MNIKRKNILFISISAPPKNAPESIQTAKYLKYLSEEFDITLVTSKIQKGWRPKDSSLIPYLNNIGKTIEIGLLNNKFLIFFLRKIIPIALHLPDSDFSFHLQWKKVLKRIKNDPDIIYSRSTPISSHILALKVKKKCVKIPWIMHLSDPWVDNPYSELKGLALIYHRKKEKECFKYADFITLTSNRALEFYKEKYPIYKKKFGLSYNVYDDQHYSKNRKINFDQSFTLVHTGRLYGTRNCFSFLEAIELLFKSNPVIKKNCNIIFAGFANDDNIEALRKFGMPVEYKGNISFEESVNLQKNAHVLISIDANETEEQFKLFFPSKLLDYILVGRRILAITPANSTTQEIMEKGYGESFRHTEVKEIASFLEKAYNAYLNKDNNFFSAIAPPHKYSVSYNVNCLKEIINSKI